MAALENEKLNATTIRIDVTMLARLDTLAELGDLYRTSLILSLVSTWLSALDGTSPGFFYIANLLRVREEQLNGRFAYEHEFSGKQIPEKTLPIKFSESDYFRIAGFASQNHITKHEFLKTMVIVGIEELEKLTDRQPFQYSDIKPKLHRIFTDIMKKGFKAFQAYMGKKILF